MKSIADTIGNTPLVSLQHIGRDLPLPIYVKCEHMNPGGSIKDRIALAIIDDAEARGILKPGMTLVEATAGNTGMGLALVAATRGYKLVCVMPQKMSEDKRAALRMMGAKVVIADNAPPTDPRNFQNVARALAQREDHYLTDQFSNPANVEIHATTTARELLEQCDGHIGAFVAGVGTGGTLSGVGRVLKQHLPDVHIVLADPVGSSLADLIETGVLGPSASYAVEGIGTSAPPDNLHLDVIDAAERVSDEESFEITRQLVQREGLLVGGSSGTNVAAALRVAARGQAKGPVVTLVTDSWDRYWTQPWMQAWGR